jgi:transcriptional regulator with XRE-family HTH domain
MFHETIRNLRTNKGLTGETVANAIGISESAYRNYERGVREPSFDILAKLADFYGVTTDYLLGREDKNDPIANIAAQYGLAPAAKAVLAAYLYMDSDMRTALLDTIKQLVNADDRPTMTIRKHINKAAAGSGYDLADDDEFEDITIIRTNTAEQADFAVEVDGDSMEPDYHDGDIVFVRIGKEVPVGAVGLFIHEGKGYIKERGETCLISRNPEYENICGECIAVGEVIGTAELVQ